MAAKKTTEISKIELLSTLSPEEQTKFLGLVTDMEALGAKATRAQMLKVMLPHLQSLFGVVYDEYKPELEDKYGEELVAAHKEMGETK